MHLCLICWLQIILNIPFFGLHGLCSISTFLCCPIQFSLLPIQVFNHLLRSTLTSFDPHINVSFLFGMGTWYFSCLSLSESRMFYLHLFYGMIGGAYVDEYILKGESFQPSFIFSLWVIMYFFQQPSIENCIHSLKRLEPNSIFSPFNMR